MSAVTLTLRRRDLAWSVALIVLLSAVWVARSDIADAGGSPPGQGIAVVYVAVGTGFPDALGVGPGAALNGAPIILVPTNPPLDSATSAELVRLDPREVIIVGGTAVVSASMESTLVTLLPNAVVSRIAGANRYKTNAAFSAAEYPVEAWASVPAYAFSGPNPEDIVLGDQRVYSTTDGVILAPIQLPDGAKIIEFTAQVFDADSGSYVFLALIRIGVTGATEHILSVTSDVALNEGVTDLSDTTFSIAGAEIVDNENWSYGLDGYASSSNLYVRSVRVRYQLGATG